VALSVEEVLTADWDGKRLLPVFRVSPTRAYRTRAVSLPPKSSTPEPRSGPSRRRPQARFGRLWPRHASTGRPTASLRRRSSGVGCRPGWSHDHDLGRSAQCADGATNATRQRTNGERDRLWGQFAPGPPADRPLRAREEQAITLSKESRTHARSAQRPGTVSRLAQQRVDERVREIMSRRRRGAAQRDAPPEQATPARPASGRSARQPH
jgi:hypothetical protein